MESIYYPRIALLGKMASGIDSLSYTLYGNHPCRLMDFLDTFLDKLISKVTFMTWSS